MALTGRLHPLLVHFPIALVLIAAVAELVSLTTQCPEWRAVAVANIRVGAAFAVASAGAGWILASSRIVEASPALEWHRWLVSEPRGYSFAARIVRQVVQREMVTPGQRRRVLEAARRTSRI